MSIKRSSYEAGHKRKYLVVIDDTEECERAVYWAAKRAGRTKSQIVMLRVIETAEPLLAALGGLDHAQHDDLRLGAAGALGGPIDRALALLGVVDDHQVFALVAGLIAAALDAHRRSRLFRDRRTSDRWWHGWRRADKPNIPRMAAGNGP